MENEFKRHHTGLTLKHIDFYTGVPMYLAQTVLKGLKALCSECCDDEITVESLLNELTFYTDGEHFYVENRDDGVFARILVDGFHDIL